MEQNQKSEVKTLICTINLQQRRKEDILEKNNLINK